MLRPFSREDVRDADRVAIKKVVSVTMLFLAVIAIPILISGSRAQDDSEIQPQSHKLRGFDLQIDLAGQQMMERGKETFRNDTFGNETFWTDTIQLDQAIIGQQFGGEGGGLTPAAAMGLGLKVDSHALTNNMFKRLRRGTLNLQSAETTIELLRANAIV